MSMSATAHQFSRFLLVGAFSAAVNVTSRFLFNYYVSFEAAVALGYFAGMITAFILFRALVFDPTARSIKSEFFRFALVNAMAFALVWTLSVGLARVVFPAVGYEWYANDVAHLIGVTAPALTSFLGHRYYTFATTH